MLLRGARLSHTALCGLATLLIATSTSGCRRPQALAIAGQKHAPKSHKAGTKINDDCDGIAGDDDYPPSTPEPKDGAHFRDYADSVCFAYDDEPPKTGQGEWADVRVIPATNGQQLEIMPEVRMRHTDPTVDADKGQGMVVALVHNSGSKAYGEPNNKYWKSNLQQDEDALIWLSQDSSTAVLFSYRVSPANDTTVTVLSRMAPDNSSGRSAWNHMHVAPSNKYPRHARARWIHPTESLSQADGTPIRQQGMLLQYDVTGWVTCLDGCCTPNGIIYDQ